MRPIRHVAPGHGADPPVPLIAAGPRQIVGLTGRSKAYAERMFDFPRRAPLRPTETAFTVPMFDRCLRRITPGWRRPYLLQD